MQKFFLADFDKNDIFSDFFETFKRNDIFGVASEKSADFSGAGDNDGFDAAVADVENDIYDTAEPLAVACVDDFFFTKLTKSHRETIL